MRDPVGAFVPPKSLGGGVLFAALAALGTGVCLGAYLVDGGETGLQAWIRNTARFSTGYFGVAFVTSSLLVFGRGPWTLWLRRNRRVIGLAFAFTMTLHLAGLAALAYFYPEPFLSGVGLLTLLGGGTAYAFIYLLAFTSSDSAQRALGLRRWQWLHTIGGWVIWVVFVETLTLGVIEGDRSRLASAVFLWAVGAMRLIASRR